MNDVAKLKKNWNGSWKRRRNE